MDWYFVGYNLLVPSILLPGLVQHLIEAEEVSANRTNEFPVDPDESHVLDYPGMCSMLRHLQPIHVDGLTVKIPSTDFVRMYHEINSLSLSQEGGIPHYRIYGYLRCLVLTIEQRGAFLYEMGKHLQSSVEIADWENARLNSAFGDDTVDVKVSTGDVNDSPVKVFKKPTSCNLLVSPKPVIDRDIDDC